MPGSSILNALTIDVEDYFQVTAFSGVIKRADWNWYPLRVEHNTNRLLDLLDRFSVKATFFCLGWIAERTPGLVRGILNRGHEIASHGYGHELVYQIGPERFREDIRRGKGILEDITGAKVRGYRAPSYSITQKSLWALELLVQEGFCYDSSIFPVVHDHYGIPDAPRYPHAIDTGTGTIWEFPLTTLEMWTVGRKLRLPIAGGGYLRLFPSALIAHWMRRINHRDQQPTVLYLHPWEIDTKQPRVHARMKSRFRHYLNLGSTEKKLCNLINSLPFDTMNRVLTDRFPAFAARA